MYKPYEEEEKKKKQASQTNTTTAPQTKTAPQQSTAPQYKPSNTVQTAQQNLATHTASKPTQYQSNWASQLDGLMSQIMNREKFSYDMNADALYQQAKDMYTNQANMGMQNAMAQASALTGGYGSSYGQMVGQQAYAQQMQGLNNMLPELYQNALNQYINEGNELYNRYNMVANQENLDYGRYRDSMNDYLAERDYLNSIYNTEAERDYNRYLDERNYTYQTDRDAIADSRYEQEWAASEEQRLHDNAYQDKLFDYNASRDEAADAQWREQFEYGKEQDALAQENWYKQFEYAQEQDRLAQENWNKQFEYGKEQDALAQKNWQDQFEYGKTQDALDNKYRDDAFAYQQEQDKLAQKNWQAQFDANQTQQEKENKWYEDSLKASKNTATYEGTGVFEGEEVPIQLSGVPGLTTVNPKFFDENGNFKSATLAYEDVDGTGAMIWNIGGKEVKLQKGVNPYTNNTNKDIKNGALANGYQPDNVGGEALSETDIYDYINGVKTPVYQTSDGKQWIWDDSSNEYLEYGDGEPSKGSNEPSKEEIVEDIPLPPGLDGYIPTGTVIDAAGTVTQPKEEEYPDEWREESKENWADKVGAAQVAGTLTNPNDASNDTPSDAYDKMLNMGWEDVTNAPYSRAQRDKLIADGKMIAIEVNGEIKYLMR